MIFYFAGHGQTEELPGGGKQGYIIPVDAGLDDFTATAISMEADKKSFQKDSCKTYPVYNGLVLFGVGP